MSNDELMRIRGAELAELSYHWGSAYVVSFEHGMFCARRRDDGSVVRCAEPDDLYDEIRRDYEARPVPRIAREAVCWDCLGRGKDANGRE
jgi:hypothetical protein